MTRVLLTRDALHNMLFRKTIQEQGEASDIVVLEAPLLEQVPMTGSMENLQVFLQSKVIQEVIFISPSSVEFGVQTVFQKIQLQRVFAVGKGTASLIRTSVSKLSQHSDESNCNNNINKIDVLFPKTGVGSEALLDLPEMQNLDGKQVLIVTGSEGKPYLETQLMKRGAHVSRWECYERKKPVALTAQMVKIFKQPLDYVFLHSPHAAKHFLQETPLDSELNHLTAVVGAQSIADELEKHSWPGHIKVADSPMPKDMLKVFKHSLAIN